MCWQCHNRNPLISYTQNWLNCPNWQTANCLTTRLSRQTVFWNRYAPINDESDSYHTIWLLFHLCVGNRNISHYLLVTLISKLCVANTTIVGIWVTIQRKSLQIPEHDIRSVIYFANNVKFRYFPLKSVRNGVRLSVEVGMLCRNIKWTLASNFLLYFPQTRDK